MHDVVIVGIPLMAILAGILFNRNDTRELRSEMLARFSEVNHRFDKVDEHLERIDADLRQFYHLSGKLEGRSTQSKSAAKPNPLCRTLTSR